MSLKIQFEILEGPGQGEIKEYATSFMNIGSLGTDDLIFDSSTGVLPNHATVRVEDDKIILINNCFSTIYVNGSIISQKELEHNDEIKFGSIGPKLRFISSDGSVAKEEVKEEPLISDEKVLSEETDSVSSPAPVPDDYTVETPVISDTPADIPDIVEPATVVKAIIAEETSDGLPLKPDIADKIESYDDLPDALRQEIVTPEDITQPAALEDTTDQPPFAPFDQDFKSFETLIDEPETEETEYFSSTRGASYLTEKSKQILEYDIKKHEHETEKTEEPDTSDPYSTSFYTHKETHTSYQKTFSTSDGSKSEEVSYTVEKESSDKPEDSDITVEYKYVKEGDNIDKVVAEHSFNIDEEGNVISKDEQKAPEEEKDYYSRHIKEAYHDIKAEKSTETSNAYSTACTKSKEERDTKHKRPVAPGNLNFFVYIYETLLQELLALIANTIDEILNFQTQEQKRLKLEIEKTLKEHKKKKKHQEFFFSYKRKQAFMKEHHSFFVNGTLTTLGVNAVLGFFPCLGQLLGLAIPVIISSMVVKSFNHKYIQMEKREAHTVILASSIILTFNFIMFIFHMFVNVGSPYRVLWVFLTIPFMIIQLVIADYFVFKDAREREEKELIK